MGHTEEIKKQNKEMRTAFLIGLFFAICMFLWLVSSTEQVKNADTKVFEQQDAAIAPLVRQVQLLSNDSSQIVITRGARYISRYDRKTTDYAYYVYIEPVAYNAIEASSDEYAKYDKVRLNLYNRYHMTLEVDTTYTSTEEFEQYKIIYQQNTNVK